MDGLWKEGFRHAARYNAETNGAMYAALGDLPGNGLSADRGSYFGSLMGILNHIIVIDIHWLDRYRALSPEAKSLSDGRLAAFPLSWEPLSDDFSVLSDARSAVDDLIREWFDEFPEGRYGDSFSYRDSKGSLNRTRASAAFDFLFLHQAHHRGQISQVMDSLGLPQNFADNQEFLKVGR